MKRGFVLGKFMPPHAGHVYLCEFARRLCDRLTILVCSLPDDPIDGALRFRWMQELFPSCNVIHLDEVIPQEPSEHPNFWPIWRSTIRRLHPEPVALVFASEGYGLRLAQELEAEFVPVDPHRLAMPISGTVVRNDPMRAWPYLPLPVRAHFTKVVCCFGPESSGKTTLAEELGRLLNTVVVPEYARPHTDTFGHDCSAADLRKIAERQDAAIDALRGYASRVLIADTDSLLTSIWGDMFGHRVEGGAGRPADLYLLTDIDIPWHDDGTRYFPEHAKRREFFDRCLNALEARGLPFVRVSGDRAVRLKVALEAIRARFPSAGMAT